MDDLDRELKLVQLQRERLALEHEMALHGAKKAKEAAKTITQGITFPFKAIGQSFKRRWKVLLTILTLSVGIAAGLLWMEHQRQQAQEAIYGERVHAWYAGLKQFTNQKCPEATYTCSTANELAYKDPFDQFMAQTYSSLICRQKGLDWANCSLGAKAEYTKRIPAPRLSND
jgi:hypothetical protein